ncbi:unnamed protein product [Symbiodinium microadriaticum]|nr:unnamed protein product [Symbiodinium microadriaticum]
MPDEPEPQQASEAGGPAAGEPEPATPAPEPPPEPVAAPAGPCGDLPELPPAGAPGSVPATVPAAPKKRGRPPGSKNKPKPPPQTVPADPGPSSEPLPKAAAPAPEPEPKQPEPPRQPVRMTPAQMRMVRQISKQNRFEQLAMANSMMLRSFWKHYPSYRVQPLLQKRYHELLEARAFNEWLENRRIRKEGEEYTDTVGRLTDAVNREAPVRLNYGQVLGYIEEGEPLPVELPKRNAFEAEDEGYRGQPFPREMLRQRSIFSDTTTDFGGTDTAQAAETAIAGLGLGAGQYAESAAYRGLGRGERWLDRTLRVPRTPEGLAPPSDEAAVDPQIRQRAALQEARAVQDIEAFTQGQAAEAEARGTDSDQSRPSSAVDIQTLNGMQESGVQQHFSLHQQRQRRVIRIDSDSDSAPRAQPAPRVRARAVRQQPPPFGLNPVPLPRPQGQSSGSEGSRISRQSRGPLGAEPSFDQLRSAVNDELTQSLDYKLATSNVNYVQSRRDVQYYPSSLSTFTPTTSRVARIPLTSGMDFIDPESVKIAFRIRNNNTDADGLFPGTIEPSCFIKRVQLYSNGQRTDDISEYGRSCYLYSLLKPQEWYNQRGLEGFWQDPGGHAVEIPAGEYREVLMAPTLIGLFQCGKMLPPQLNLVLELEFAEAADALRPAGGTTDFSIENVRVLASQVTLDSALQESFNKVLLSGRSLIFSYPTMHTQVSNVPAGVTSHNVTVARAYTKLMGAFVTFRQLSDSEGECKNLEYPGNPITSPAEFHHFLEVMGGIRNMRIVDHLYSNDQFIAAFPTERVPKHPLSGISTRSGDLARFTFKNMLADRVERMYIHLGNAMSLFESTITGNILNDGQTTETTGITAGQLATVLTAYTPITDTATNTAAIGTNAAGVAANAAAVAALQAEVAGLPGPPDLAPYALAADLAAAEGQLAASQSSITALNTSLTTGLAAKANQSALDALQLEVDGKSTPASVDAKLASYSTTAAMNSAIASANNATLATVGSTYALRSVTDQLALDLAAKQSGLDVDQKIATALLDRPSTTDLNAAVGLRTSPADVDQKLATALLTFVTQAALDAALALRDGRLDAAEGAGPFASAADLDSLETSLQSAIDAVLAQLAVLAAGAVQNAPEWAGQTTFELLVGASTLRRLHVTAPLSISLQNEDLALSIACDSYSTAQADAAIAAAIAAALAPYETAAQRDAAITAALAAFSNTAEVNALIAAALVDYSTTAQMDAAIAAAVGAIDLSGYYSSAQTDAAITAALVPVTLSNAPAWGANPPTWELLKGTNVLRNLHFAGPLLASLQNNTDTLQIECDAYDKSETYTQAEVNTVVSSAIDAPNITQYQTETDVDTAISDALLDYYTSAQVDAEIAANGFDGSQYWTKTQSDSRYFVSNANAGNISLIRDAVTPPTLRVLIPRSPLNINVILSGTALELTCDAYTRSEADGRYVQSGNLTSLDSRYFPVNGNNGGGGIFAMVITTLTPRMIRAILPRAPLSGALILGNAGTLADVAALDAPVTASPLPADISVNSVSATGDWLSLLGGTAGTRIRDGSNNDLITVTGSEAFFGVRSRVDYRLTIDTPSGPDEGLYTAAVRARTADTLLTLTGGTAGLRAEGALELTGILTGTEAVFPTRLSTPELAPSPSSNAYMRLFTGTTGLEVADQSLNPLLQVEDDETKSLSRVLQLDANAALGFAQLEVASTGGCTLNAPGQEIWLQNRVTGQAPLIVETNSVVTVSYGFNNLSDARIKKNIREADLEALQAVFDAAQPKLYDRSDAEMRDCLGFLAQDFQGSGVTGTTKREGQELLTLDYCRLTAMLWGVMAEQAALELLRQLAQDFSVRDPRKLYQIAKREFPERPGVTQALARRALQKNVARQVLAPKPRSLGKSAAEGPNDRLQADLIDFSQNTRSRNKYGLVVTDVFTREAVTRPLPDKNAATVARAAAEAIPELVEGEGNYVVTTDEGHEFRTLEAALPGQAVHRTKRPQDRNATAAVDRLIQTLKKDLAGEVARHGGKWDDHAANATEAYNARPHEAVHAAPEDVETQPATQFRVLQDNAAKFQHNKQLTEGRRARLQQAGAFRAPTNAGRSFQAQYGPVKELASADSMTARATDGTQTLLKHALPVPRESTEPRGALTTRPVPLAVRQLRDFNPGPTAPTS